MFQRLFKLFSREPDPHDWVEIRSVDALAMSRIVAQELHCHPDCIYLSLPPHTRYTLRVCLKTHKIEDKIQEEIDHQLTLYNEKQKREEKAKQIFEAKKNGS